jgi:3-deoxy-D-manno-octulosonic-acid transferase
MYSFLFIIIYFLVQILVLVCGWPFLLFWRWRRPEKFRHLRRRLFADTALAAVARRENRPRIWLHALSVGEVSSALPLARAIRGHFPQAFFVVTVATETGENFARHVLANTADSILLSPLDWLPSVRRFLRHLRPDLYIQVETDFWPGLLFSLRQENIPALLVNGRISAASSTRYRRLRALFLPMFACFSTLAMQTAADRDKMLALGIAAARLPVLGNLKYAAGRPAQGGQAVAALLPPGRRLWLCGSTHPGEDEIIFAAYRRVCADFPDLFLLLAPRRPERGDELARLAARHELTARLRSRPDGENGVAADLFILDTIGELAACYFLADIAFIGGSLVAEGGHNPLEAAWAGKPVLFGPHMEDFAEIAAGLIAVGAARMVTGASELTAELTAILADPAIAGKMGAAALAFVQAKRQGVLDGHLEVITTLLAAAPDGHRKHKNNAADR